jgi:small ligand-binding sensory domain FIST
MLMLAEPYSFPVGDFLEVCNAQVPGVTVIGGMASAGTRAGANRLAVDDRVLDHGAVALLCSDDVPVRAVVSQGCRPIGTPLTVTSAEQNLVHELAGQPAMARLQELVQAATEPERELMRNGLHLGVVVDEHKLDFSRGDFLVRNVLGADRNTGSVAVGDRVDVGTTVQFQVRDADSADEDLRALLAGVRGDAALLFTCNGRGRRLFSEPNHDAGVVEELLGVTPLAGGFCAGEIGPVGGRNFLHSFTASVAVFER